MGVPMDMEVEVAPLVALPAAEVALEFQRVMEEWGVPEGHPDRLPPTLAEMQAAAERVTGRLRMAA